MDICMLFWCKYVSTATLHLLLFHIYINHYYHYHYFHHIVTLLSRVVCNLPPSWLPTINFRAPEGGGQSRPQHLIPEYHSPPVLCRVNLLTHKYLFLCNYFHSWALRLRPRCLPSSSIVEIRLPFTCFRFYPNFSCQIHTWHVVILKNMQTYTKGIIKGTS
jgi:hypothetical protein